MSEHTYKEFTYAFTSKGLAARFVIDKTPPSMYWNLLGLEVRQDASLSSRLGRIPITMFQNEFVTIPLPLPDTNIHTLARLKSVFGKTFRYAGANQNIYRRTGDDNGAYGRFSAINQMSGNRFSSATYRPNFSSFPYIFFADQSVMLKDNGSFNPLQQWGIFPPLIPISAQLSGPLLDSIDLFGAVHVGAGFGTEPIDLPKSYSNFSAPLTATISTVNRVSGLVTVNTVTPHGIPSGGTGNVFLSGVADSSFTGHLIINSVTSSTSFTCFSQSPHPDASSSGGNFFCYQSFYRVNTSILSAISPTSGGQLLTVTPTSMVGIVPGMVLGINVSNLVPDFVLVVSTTATTFTAFFSVSQFSGATVTDVPFSGTVAANTTAMLTGSGIVINLNNFFSNGSNIPSKDADLISFFYNISLVSNVTSLTIQFDVSGVGDFSDSYSTIVSLVGVLNNTWTQFSLAKGSFTENGAAGSPGKTWANVDGYRIILVTNTGGGVTFEVDGLNMNASGGPNVGPGSPYDYRYTYFNNNTGSESNPSVLMVTSAFVSPNNQPVILNFTPPTDPQITDIRVYRRGGTLNVGWTLVADLPATATSYVDSFPDFSIDANLVLAIDNDPPLTVSLPVPVNTTLGTIVTAGSSQTVTPSSMANIFVNQILTIDSGTSQQETVTVQAVTPTTFTAYFQTTHALAANVSASTRQGQPVNLATIAFDQAWLAGDPNNPNRLYYSKVTNPEAFPPENWIEIGTPADPIMATVFFRGQLFALTQSRIYRVIIPYPGAIPAPYPTSSRHGLYANFGFCLSEGLIPYLSKDGIYIFQGDASNYASEVIEWLFADREPNLGPIPEQNPTQAANTIMAFTKNEFYVGYTDKTGVQRRVSYDLRSNSWRNDDVAVTAMFYEEDTEELIIAENQDGMIYRDRRGDTDIDIISPGVVGPIAININLQTACQDQGLPLNDKSYNELSLDVDWPSPLSVALLFDNGTSPLPLGSFQTVGRQRIPIPINAGVGRLSQNVALQISGTIGLLGPGHFYNWYIKAATEAEYRESFDSYWSKQGTDEYKVWKQGQFEYVAADIAGISFSVYIEGNMVTPAYTFVLPQSTVRTAVRVRFPAVKAKVWRLIGMSATRFQLYGESFIEFKPITLNKGYAKENLGQMISAQSSV